MYLSILKKDLKRKKTMNMIILVFVILSAMFFSSSVNNIVSVIGGVDRFIDMAGMKDYFVMVSEPDSGTPFGDKLDKSDNVKSYTRETFILCTSDSVKHNGAVMKGASSREIIVPSDDMCITCFDKNNEPITSVGKGKVMVAASLASKSDIKEGDTITVDMYGVKLDLEMAGICKDAVLGSEMCDSPRFILSPEDFDTLYSNDTIRKTSRSGFYNIETDNTDAINDIIINSDGCSFHGSRSLVKTTFLINISVAAILMIVSIFLIIISFVVLRFTIGFTIQEEFREIGVMKAIGIKNRSIRLLYLVKYLGIAVIGSAIGFFAAIPFGNILLDSVSSGMVLGNDSPVLIGILCSAGVVLLILLFCWSCTSKIKKLSPIDAVRNGQTGERFRKHRLISLGKSRLGATGYLSLNDILSNPKQSAILTVVFTLCAMLVMVLSSTAKTLSSDELIYIVGTSKSDVYVDINSGTREVQNGLKTLNEIESEMEKTLAENGMPGKVKVESMYSTSTEFKGKISTGRFLICHDTKCSDYVYGEGTPPQYANEVALGYATAEEIGAGVGDTVDITVNGETDQFVVTALLDSMSNMGKCGRFNESFELPDSAMIGTMAYQITFDDAPDARTINERIEKLKEIYSTEKVYDGSGYVNDCTKASDAIKSVKNLTMAVSVIIIMLLSVLLEKSFISKERAEIALVKAIGFKNRSVILTHILRFVIISAVSVAIAALLCSPTTKLIMDPLFALLGAVNGLKYAFDPLEALVIFPLLVLLTVTAATFVTALSTNRIKASDTSNIE